MDTNHNSRQIDGVNLRRLKPLGELSDADLRHLISHAQLAHMQPGDSLKINPDSHRFLDYLISGKIELQGDNQSQYLITEDTYQANRPLKDSMVQYRKIIAHTNCAVLRIDQNQLEQVLQAGWHQETKIDSLTDENEALVIKMLLKNSILRALSEEKFNHVIQKMQLIDVKAGETIIWQGDKDNGYYSIISGYCTVSRRPHIKAEDIVLVKLGPGDGFGEDALITNKKRNASVTMRSDGTLMRLEKEDFLSLVVEQLINFYDYEQLDRQVHKGAKVIDVRGIDEYERNGIGLHIPLLMLRRRLKTISHNNEYIFCCNDGHLSIAAALIAIEYGFNSGVLRGGLNAVSHPGVKWAH